MDTDDGRREWGSSEREIWFSFKLRNNCKNNTKLDATHYTAISPFASILRSTQPRGCPIHIISPSESKRQGADSPLLAILCHGRSAHHRCCPTLAHRRAQEHLFRSREEYIKDKDKSVRVARWEERTSNAIEMQELIDQANKLTDNNRENLNNRRQKICQLYQRENLPRAWKNGKVKKTDCG